MRIDIVLQVVFLCYFSVSKSLIVIVSYGNYNTVTLLAMID